MSDEYWALVISYMEHCLVSNDSWSNGCCKRLTLSWVDKPSGQTKLWMPICQGYFCHLAGGQCSKAGLLYSFLKFRWFWPLQKRVTTPWDLHSYVLDEGAPSSVQKLNLATRINPASKGFTTNSNTFNQTEIWRQPAYSLIASTEKNISE